MTTDNAMLLDKLGVITRNPNADKSCIENLLLRGDSLSLYAVKMIQDNVKDSLTKRRKTKPLESGYYWVQRKNTLYWQVGFWDSYPMVWQFCGDAAKYPADSVDKVIRRALKGIVARANLPDG